MWFILYTLQCPVYIVHIKYQLFIVQCIKGILYFIIYIVQYPVFTVLNKQKCVIRASFRSKDLNLRCKVQRYTLYNVQFAVYNTHCSSCAGNLFICRGETDNNDSSISQHVPTLKRSIFRYQSMNHRAG